jgi:hypothetical protein
VSEVAIPPEGRVVHLRGYGLVRVFRSVSRDGDAEHWATDDPDMGEEERKALSSQGWGIEEYHRGVKQCCGIERAQVRGAWLLSSLRLSSDEYQRRRTPVQDTKLQGISSLSHLCTTVNLTTQTNSSGFHSPFMLIH